MPPPLAFVLCLVVIAWLLFCELRRHASVSASLWIPTLLVFVLGSRPVSIWFGTGVLIGASNDAEGSALDRAFYLSVIIAAWLLASMRRVPWRKLFAANRSLMVFYVYFAMSVLWSSDPGGSFKRVTKDFGNLFVISVILSEGDPLQAIRAVYLRCACVTIPLSVLFIRYYPDLGRAYSIAGEAMFTGVTTQKNSLGELLMVSGIVLVWDYLETRSEGKPLWLSISWDRVVLVLMGLWLLQISDSKTAIVSLTIGLFLLLRTGRLASETVSGIVLLAALSAPFIVLFLQELAPLIGPVVETLGRDLTFTGRTDIWRHITWTTVDPFVGAGFFNFWGGRGGSAIRDAMGTPGLFSAHNGYLDIYLDGGMVGLVLLFYLLLTRGTRMIRTLRASPFHRLRFAVLVAGAFYNLSESTFARPVLSWFMLLIALIDFPSTSSDPAGSGRPAAMPPSGALRERAAALR